MLQSDLLNYRTLPDIIVQWLKVVYGMVLFSCLSEVSEEDSEEYMYNLFSRRKEKGWHLPLRNLKNSKLLNELILLKNDEKYLDFVIWRNFQLELN